MKWCRVATRDGAAYAIVEGGEVELLDAAPFANGRPTGVRHRLADVSLLPPVMPYNFYAAGLNYRYHVEWAKQHYGMNLKIPDRAEVNYRSPSALVGSGDVILIPADSEGPVDYEGELVAVIGKAARDVREEDALDCVAGYTLGNDLSERAWQLSDRTLWRSKNPDTFKPMGPVVVSGIDPMNQQIAVRINGDTVSEYSTRDMIFSVAHWIATISRYSTLQPGDVLWLGCDGATLPSLREGDLVEVVNASIGVLANRVGRARTVLEKA